MPARNDKEDKDPVKNRRPTHVALPEVGPSDGDSPYEVLSEFGATYDSSMSAVHRAGLNAQKARKLDSERRRAWKELRDVEQRLIIDATWLALPGGGGPETIPPPAVRLPEVPPPERAEILAQIGRVPVPDVPPHQQEERPALPVDRWGLADELLEKIVSEMPYEDEIPSFLEDTV